MSILTNINGSDNISASRSVINANFSALNGDKVEDLADLGITASANDINQLPTIASQVCPPGVV